MTEIHNTYSAITRQIREEAALCLENGRICLLYTSAPLENDSEPLV